MCLLTHKCRSELKLFVSFFYLEAVCHVVFPTKASGKLICVTSDEGVSLNQDRGNKLLFVYFFYAQLIPSAAKMWNYLPFPEKE